MKLLLKNKPVDKSLLTEGSHLPPANNDLLFSLLGKSIAYEEKENIIYNEYENNIRPQQTRLPFGCVC